ncbi:MAG TPA: flavodoxin family protein [Syntrophorhabdaceae bacterium]
MNVLILSGSPRGPKSVTNKLLAALAAGISAGNGQVRQFSVCSMKIASCIGCLACMHKTPGVCAIKDDMEEIYGALKTSDILVIGTPVYVDSMSSQMKAVIDRSVACLQPFLVRDKTGRIRHPFNWRMPGRFLLVSTSGFPETATFDPLIATFRAGAANFGAEPIGEVCIPGSIALQIQPDLLAGHLRLIEEMGQGLALEGRIDGESLKKINIPPVQVGEYLEIAASYESWCRERLGDQAKP